MRFRHNCFLVNRSFSLSLPKSGCIIMIFGVFFFVPKARMQSHVDVSYLSLFSSAIVKKYIYLKEKHQDNGNCSGKYYTKLPCGQIAFDQEILSLSQVVMGQGELMVLG